MAGLELWGVWIFGFGVWGLDFGPRGWKPNCHSRSAPAADQYPSPNMKSPSPTEHEVFSLPYTIICWEYLIWRGGGEVSHGSTSGRAINPGCSVYRHVILRVMKNGVTQNSRIEFLFEAESQGPDPKRGLSPRGWRSCSGGGGVGGKQNPFKHCPK